DGARVAFTHTATAQIYTLSLHDALPIFDHLAEIHKASLSYEIPNGNAGFRNGLYKMGEDSNAAVSVTILQTDEAYAETYQISLRSEEHTSELQSRESIVSCLLLV